MESYSEIVCSKENKWKTGTCRNMNESHKHNANEKSFTTKEYQWWNFIYITGYKINAMCNIHIISKNYIGIQISCNQRFQEGFYFWKGQKLVTVGRHEDGTECLCCYCDFFFHYFKQPMKRYVNQKTGLSHTVQPLTLRYSS